MLGRTKGRKTDLEEELEGIEGRVERKGSLEPYYIKNAQNPSHHIVSEEEERGLYSIPDVQRIINLLINDVKELKPVFDLHYSCRYPDIEHVTELKPNEIPSLLDRLSTYRVLDSHFYERTVICDKCSSPNVASRFLCAHCKSTDILQKRTIEHLSCGYVCSEDQLIVDEDTMRCPRCTVQLFFNGGPDVKINEGWFMCNDCLKASRDPMIFFFCRNCERLISVNDVAFRNLRSYTLSKSFNMNTIVLIEPFRELLVQMGYKVDSPGRITGKSGVEYLFDIVASKDDKTLVVNVVYSDVMVTEAPLVKMFGAVFDCKPSKAVLIAVPESAESVIMLSKEYGIVVLSAKEPKELSDMLKGVAVAP